MAGPESRIVWRVRLAVVEQMRLCAEAGGLWSEADFVGRAGTHRGFIEKES